MRARVKKVQDNTGSTWWLADKVGQWIEVSDDLIEKESGCEVMLDELDGLLPDDVDGLLEDLNNDVAPKAYFRHMPDGTVRLYVSTEFKNFSFDASKHGVKIEYGLVWLDYEPPRKRLLKKMGLSLRVHYSSAELFQLTLIWIRENCFVDFWNYLGCDEGFLPLHLTEFDNLFEALLDFMRDKL